jgi:UDPglucose 6-dehydrogenase
MSRRIVQACGGDVRGKRIAILGLTFKPNTDDMRDAPSIALITALQDLGAQIIAYDPIGMDQAEMYMTGVEFASDAYACAKDADVLVIVTEWDAFRALDLDRIKSALKESVIVDLRNIYRPADIRSRGFRYISVGRP